MKLILGIGNPEFKYKNTRHNAGLMVIDELASRKKVKGIIVRRSDKSMNNSGRFVEKQVANYRQSLTNGDSLKLDSLYVVHDDLDIPIGAFKIQFGKGPKVHNGLNDIYEKIGTSDFWHVRVGVDNRKTEDRMAGKEYVLRDFSEEEKLILNGVINEICNQLVV